LRLPTSKPLGPRCQKLEPYVEAIRFGRGGHGDFAQFAHLERSAP